MKFSATYCRHLVGRCTVIVVILEIIIILSVLSTSKVDEMFATSQTFFDKPIEVKQKYAKPADSGDGWVSLEREK